MPALRDVAPRRVVLVTAALAAAIMGDSMLYNVLPANVSSFGVSVGLVGVLLSANRFVRLASNPFASWLVQRHGYLLPLLISSALAVGTTLMLGLTKGFALLLLARLLWGMSFSVFRLSGYLVALEESGEGGRGRVLGFFSGGQRMGSVVGVLLGGVLFDLIGRAGSFTVIGALGLLSIPAALALGRGSMPINPIVSGQSAVPSLGGGQGSGDKKTRLVDFVLSPAPELSPLQRQKLLAVNLTLFVFHLVMGGVLVATLGFYLSQRLGDGAALAGVVLGIATINGLLLATRWLSDVASPYLGHLGDRLGQDKALVFTIPAVILALLLLSGNAPLWAALPWLALTFIAAASSLTALTALAGDLAPAHRRAQVMSRFATWQDLGAALGPLLAYAVITSIDIQVVYLAGAGLLTAALLFFAYSFKLTGAPTLQKPAGG